MYIYVRMYTCKNTQTLKRYGTPERHVKIYIITQTRTNIFTKKHKSTKKHNEAELENTHSNKDPQIDILTNRKKQQKTNNNIFT